MNNDQIRKIALDNGFKLKRQPNGEEDLNPYVYDFARALLSQVNENTDAFAVVPKESAQLGGLPYTQSQIAAWGRNAVLRGGFEGYINTMAEANSFDEHRSKAEEKIDNGARITKHRIDL